MNTRPSVPSGLNPKARRLWRSTVEQFELRADELRILEDACREVTLIDRMQEAIDAPEFSLTAKGSMGQPVAAPLVQEIRQHRAILTRLLQSLRLPDAEEETGSSRSAAARSLAEARWGRRGA